MAIRYLRSLLLSVAASVILAVPPTAMAGAYIDERPSPEAMLVDGVIVRPLGLGAMVLGAATWLVTLPFSALGGNVDVATQKLIVQPAAFTFVRPLGEL